MHSSNFKKLVMFLLSLKIVESSLIVSQLDFSPKRVALLTLNSLLIITSSFTFINKNYHPLIKLTYQFVLVASIFTYELPQEFIITLVFQLKQLDQQQQTKDEVLKKQIVQMLQIFGVIISALYSHCYTIAIAKNLLLINIILQVLVAQLFLFIQYKKNSQHEQLEIQLSSLRSARQDVQNNNLGSEGGEERLTILPSQTQNIDQKQQTLFIQKNILDNIDVGIMILNPECSEIYFSNRRVQEIFNCGSNNSNLLKQLEKQVNLQKQSIYFIFKAQSQSSFSMSLGQRMRQLSSFHSFKIREEPALDIVHFKQQLKQLESNFEGKFTIKVKPIKLKPNSPSSGRPRSFIGYFSKLHIQGLEYHQFIFKQKIRSNTVVKKNFNLLLRSFTHELRTPLNCSQQLLNLLLDSRKNDSELFNTITQTRNQISLLNHQIDDIIDFAAIKNDDFQYHFTDFDIENLIQKIIDMYIPATQEKKILINYSQNTSILDHLTIFNDDRRISQVLINLFNNSIKFTNSNGQINVTFDEQYNGRYKITISDNGIGIGDGVLDSIRQNMAYQDENLIDTPFLGMGLNISNLIVGGLIKPNENQKNTIQIDSVLEKGTAVSFLIDDFKSDCQIIENLNEDQIQLTPSQQIDRLNIFARGRKPSLFSTFSINQCTCSHILIVDDVPFNHIAFRLSLQRLNLSCDTSYDGQEAVNKVIQKSMNHGCSEQCRVYKIIFMDIDMPIMDGITATREITDFLQSISMQSHIIICSAFDGKEVQNLALDAGAISFLKKPVEMNSLQQCLNKFLYK